jgi:site-specific recombinase XerD
MIKPISALRRRMIDDMMMRNLSPNTQETYIRSVAQFSAFHRRSPDKLGVEHLRDFHLHLVSRGLVANSIAVKMAALRFFYGTTFLAHRSASPGSFWSRDVKAVGLTTRNPMAYLSPSAPKIWRSRARRTAAGQRHRWWSPLTGIAAPYIQ